MLLDTTSKTIEVVLGALKTTNDCPIVADWTDVTVSGGSPSAYGAGSSDGATNGTTAVTAVAAPGSSSIARRVRMLSIYNADTVSQTVTVRLNNASTLRTLKQTTLSAGQSLIYADGVGWNA